MKRIILGVCVALLAVSCVSKKVFVDLEDKYNQLLEEKKELLNKNDELLSDKNKYDTYLENLEEKYSDAIQAKRALKRETDALRKSYQDLKKTYDLLASKSSSALEANAKENRDLLSQLEEKETKLMEEGARLRKLQGELSARSKKN
jgi:chemotaxis protein MotB